ncbi:urea carboxylase-associated family protein [Flavobacterium arcticum]|uniref:Urea carboxylase-associated family protein n=1 Tax=Flavobacterium arcticum TaxID=1784713 RepID=A0A345HF23_9FLAO|nr:urea carboxylase-associated family protein [Flavobacterium arcticum]AXG75183.1 urea carboxylase-associated family protein [Flavobacterium arcticum]KAF2511035.1 urea carboxylase-associated family protein [Flavobacterium arcticum]
MKIINPRSGTSFILSKGKKLKITDIEGEQVADLLCYNLNDKKEYLSSGRTIDYAETIFLTEGHPFYSNRSNVMFTMIEDTVKRHDFLLTPCSSDTFRIIYGHEHPHQGCFGNLCNALQEYNITPDEIPTTFNVFMHVTVNGETGKVDVLPPKSKAGDYIIIEAKMDLLVGLTACSAEMSNNYSFKPIGYEILD